MSPQQQSDGGTADDRPSSAAAESRMSKHRPIQLPPLSELESYVMESGQGEAPADNFLNILPDVTSAIGTYLQTYPEQVGSVWSYLEPILKDIRRRNRLHGRHLARPAPPICAKKPSQWTTVHGQVVHDDYAWLKEKENPEVMNYLEQENKYSELSLAHTKTLQKVLFKEFVSRLNESEESARVTLSDGWEYYTRKVPGAEYRLHCRVDKNGKEEVYLDENAMAAESGDPSFFHLGFLRHTADCSLIAYGLDATGVERYTCRFLNMDTKEHLADTIPDCYEDFEFSNCGRFVFYLFIDQFERACQLRRHRLGTSVEDDVVLHDEKDDMFCLTMTKTADKRYLLLNAAAQVTSETHFLDLHDPTRPLRILFPRRDKISYMVEHHYFADAPVDSQNHRGHFYIMSNEESKNNQLFRIPVPTTAELDTHYVKGFTPEHVAHLQEIVIANRDFVLIEAFHLCARHLIVFERSNCIQIVRVVKLKADDSRFDDYHYVSFAEGLVYSIWPGSVDEEVADLSKSMGFDTNLLRFTYTSFTQPKQVIDYNMDTRVKTVVHEEQVLGPGFDPALYVNKRLWATGTDGTAIPMSVVYRRDLVHGVAAHHQAAADPNSSAATNNEPLPAVLSGGNPLLLHAYGAYGCCISPIFNTSRLSLLDRGFIFVIAHVRGGSDMGNGWYLEGKWAKKQNTFSDFISCAEYLIKEGYTTQEKLAIYGRSAGGLLIGAVVNQRPDLFKAVLTEVPFVDVINTMFDPTIPWTAYEYEEWGNPADPEICKAMNGYCPYSNIRAGALYPNMLIVGGMNDPRVAYFEPAKWTAKLRATARWAAHHPTKDEVTTEERLLLLRIQDAGHSGSSGQYGHLEDLAFEYAFLISVLGAQFRPVGSGHVSLTGVNYDMYWEELGAVGDDPEEVEDVDEEEDDDEVVADDTVSTIPRPGTPLQRFAAFWKKRGGRRPRPSSMSSSSSSLMDADGEQRQQQQPKQSPPQRKSKADTTAGEKSHSRSHSRSSSVIANGIKNLGMALRRPSSGARSQLDGREQPASPQPPPALSTNGQGRPNDNSSMSTATSDRKSSRMATTHTHISPTGSHKNPVHSHPHPQEEASGRVQSVGKLYKFVNKFF